jgi:hypothetical protein
MVRICRSPTENSNKVVKPERGERELILSQFTRICVRIHTSRLCYIRDVLAGVSSSAHRDSFSFLCTWSIEPAPAGRLPGRLPCCPARPAPPGPAGPRPRPPSGATAARHRRRPQLARPSPCSEMCSRVLVQCSHLLLIGDDVCLHHGSM